MELLGKGGYGAVYKVQLNDENKFYALKAEKKLARRDHSKLTMEVGTSVLCTASTESAD